MTTTTLDQTIAMPASPALARSEAPSLVQALAAPARLAPESGIVEVVNYGRLKPGLIPLWVGEGDLPTPAFIMDEAYRAMQAGETFYTWQRGIPDLREALSAYHKRVYGAQFGFTPERFFVTGSGMQALQLAVRLTVEAGEEVLIPGPAWPNFSAAVGVGGARAITVPMDFSANGWSLDLTRLEQAISPKTRAIVLNSPANPTGWTATREELQAVLELGRRTGLWIIADEVYGRFYYAGERAPSFHDVATPEDKVLYCNTFSKNWAMTGWRVGWIEAPAALGDAIENLIQYSTSGVAAFMQRAAIVALEEGEPFVAEQVARAKASRDILLNALVPTGRLRFAPPAGAFYLFFGIEGFTDSRALAFALVDEADVGLAPGTAFGPEGEGFLRLCYGRSPDHIALAAERLKRFIEARS